MNEMTITETAINAIKGNNTLMGKLMIAFNRTQNTIENWLNSKDVRLTTPMAVQIIASETGLSENDIINRVLK